MSQKLCIFDKNIVIIEMVFIFKLFGGEIT